MSFLKVNIFKRGYYLVLIGNSGHIHQKKYVSFKDQQKALPVLSKLNYDFVGWQYKDNNDTKTTFKTVLNINPRRQKVVEIHPLYIRQTAYIIYHGGDSPVLMDEDIVDRGEKIKLTKNRLVKAGHNFLGWTTKLNSRDVKYNDGEELTINEDLELYPVWYAYKIIYCANVERKTKSQTYYAAKGQLVNLIENPFKEPGHTFLGWAKNGEAEYPNYRAGQKVTDLTKDKEITLYAIWQVTLNRVNFDSNGGHGAMKSIATANDSVTLPKTTFYKDGYLFNGWLIKQTAKTPKYGDHATLNFDKSGQEVTLYAMWKLIFDEDYFGITKKMSKEEKLRILTKEYIRYNQLIISNNPERKQEAKAVIESISALRLIIKGT